MFQRNGVMSYKTNKMIRYVDEIFSHLSGKIFPYMIKSSDLSQFYASKFNIGITSWDCHASLVIKVKKSFTLGKKHLKKMDLRKL